MGRGLESWVKKTCKIVDGLKWWIPAGDPRVKYKTRPAPTYSQGGCGSDLQAKFGAHVNTCQVGYPHPWVKLSSLTMMADSAISCWGRGTTSYSMDLRGGGVVAAPPTNRPPPLIRAESKTFFIFSLLLH
jgi:hypothetical protein